MRSKNAIKRPLNCFFLYRQDKARQREAGELPGYPPTGSEISFSKFAAELWKNEKEEVIQEYKERARKVKETHRLQYPDYHYKPNRRTMKVDEPQGFRRRGAPIRRTLSRASASSSSSSSDTTLVPTTPHAFKPDFSFYDPGPALPHSTTSDGMVNGIVEELSRTSVASTSNAVPQMQWKGQIAQWAEYRAAAQQLYPAAGQAEVFYNYQPQVQPPNHVPRRGLFSTYMHDPASPPLLFTRGLQPSAVQTRPNHPQSVWDASCPPLDAGFYDFTAWGASDAMSSVASAGLATTVGLSVYAPPLPVATGSGSSNPHQYQSRYLNVPPMQAAQESQFASFDPLALPPSDPFLANAQADRLVPFAASEFSISHLPRSDTEHFAAPPPPPPPPPPASVSHPEQQQEQGDWYAPDSLQFASDVAAFHEAVMPRSSTPPLPGFDFAAYSFGEASGSGSALGPLPDPLEMLPADAVWPRDLDAFGIYSSPDVEKSG